MIKELIRKAINPFVEYIIWRVVHELALSSDVQLRKALSDYGDIWAIKRKISEDPDSSSGKFLLGLYDMYFAKKGSWIGYNSQFNGVPCFPHGPNGVFISGDASIGRNVVIFQHVTIGSAQLVDSKKRGSPILGDNVYIGSGASIIGNINIGDNCRIGANAVVYQDMLPHSVAVQSPTRIIQKEGLDNRYRTLRNGKWVYCDNGVIKEEKDEE